MQNSQEWWSRNTVQTFSFLLKVGRKENLFFFFFSVCNFLGRHASIFTLAKGVRCLCLTKKKPLYTRILWGALLPWLEAEPWENDSRRRVTADDNYNINIWEWERHPGKKVKAVCSQEQLRGGGVAHCGTVKQTNKRGEQTAHHTAELSWEDPAYERSYPGRSTKIDQLNKSNLDKNECH